jgi:chemotaxis methyl-accepting protein methylase
MKPLRQTVNKQRPSPLEDGSVLIESISLAISARTGIKLGVEERQMILSRVSSRILTLGLTPQEYEQRWSEPKEMEHLVSLLTTHHTYFFREDDHFQLLENKLLPAIADQLRASSRKMIRVWSAACSRGQEVYTLAAVLERFCKAHAPDLSFEVVGSDVDAASVAVAKEGVYPSSSFKNLPPSAGAEFMNSWVVGKGRVTGYLKAPKRWQERCRFQVHNLMDVPPESLGVFDVLFCRNVFIYFTNSNIQKIVSQLLPHLSENGAIFIGISESLRYLELPVKSVVTGQPCNV